MARVLFVHPLFLALNEQESAAASPYFPLGILSLAAYVREQGHEVGVFDGTFESGPQAFATRLEAGRPDVVGISAVLPNREMVLELAAIAAVAEVPVLVGGPDPTSSPEVYARHPAIDLVVHHEGEQTIARLLDLIDADSFGIERVSAEAGVAYREAGRVVVNEPRAPIENLDELPFPARDLIDMQRYLDTWEENAGYRSLTISSSRGCPYGCEWCADAVHGQAVRRRSPESVAAEMAQLAETYNIDRLRMVDDVDGIERQWLDDWAQAAEDRDAAIPFEALNDLERQDIPLLDVRDSL